MDEFKKIIQKLRTDKGYSQPELAEELHVGKSTIAMWETGDRMPNIEKLEEIADFFNVDIDYLCGRTPIKRKYSIGENGEITKEFVKEDMELIALFHALKKDDKEAIIHILKRLQP